MNLSLPILAVLTRAFKSPITIGRYCDGALSTSAESIFKFTIGIIGWSIALDITVIVTCFQKNLALISLSLIGFHSSSEFATPSD